MTNIQQAFFASSLPFLIIADQIPGLSMILTMPILVVTDLISGTKYTIMSISVVLIQNWQTLLGITQLFPVHTFPFQLFILGSMIVPTMALYLGIIKFYKRFPVFASSRVKNTLRTLKLIRGRWY